MKELDLHIPFKGNRDYLKGEDKYEGIVSFIQSNFPELSTGSLKIVFHRFSKKQCRLVCPDINESHQRPETFVDEFVCSFKDKKITGWIVETDNPVLERIPYPEEKIFNNSSIKGQKINLHEAQPDFTAMETIVSMTKKLHIVLYPSKEKKWIVTRVELRRFLQPDDRDGLCIDFKRNFNNFITKSEIYSGDDCLGDIYYSLV